MKQSNYLDKIDAYFEKQPKNVFYACIVLVFILIGYLVYSYTFDGSEEYLDEQTQLRDQAQQTLDSMNSYIDAQQRQDTIAKLKTQLTDSRKASDEVIKDNEYFDGKLREVSKILDNQKNWSNFIAKINKYATENNLKIVEIHSRRNSQAVQQIQEAFDVEFDIQGKYQSILKIINELERSVDVVDVKNITMNRVISEPKNSQDMAPNNQPAQKTQTSTNEVIAHLAISIWGLKY